MAQITKLLGARHEDPACPLPQESAPRELVQGDAVAEEGLQSRPNSNNNNHNNNVNNKIIKTNIDGCYQQQ